MHTRLHPRAGDQYWHDASTLVRIRRMDPSIESMSIDLTGATFRKLSAPETTIPGILFHGRAFRMQTDSEYIFILELRGNP